MDEMFLEDCETGLLVSNLGRVVGKTGVLLQGEINKGYIRVSYVSAKGKTKRVFVHRLVARNFLPNPLDMPVINHKDECPSNNRVDNLEWCSHKYNSNYGTAREKTMKKFISHGICRPVTLTNGVEVMEFRSFAEADGYLGSKKGEVCAVVNGRGHSVKGWHLIGDRSYKRDKVEVILEKDGIVKKFDSIHSAAFFLNAPIPNVYYLLKGKRHSCHGWHLPNVTPPRIKSSITLVKGSETRSFSSLAEAALFVGCAKGNISQLKRGVCKSIKGWTLPGTTPSRFWPISIALRKDGEIKEFASLKKASHETGISYGKIKKLLIGECQSSEINGWSLVS